jgi:acetoin:2,6-dichlorophenolindophenol oxidoreductase subunit beta
VCSSDLIMFSDFLAVCWDIVANEIAKSRYMTNGQISLPLVIRTANGAGSRFGAQHSQAVENWFLNIPGLKLAVPGTPADAYGLLRAAIRDDNPVIVFEHKGLYSLRGELPEHGDGIVELGRADVVKAGTDVTVVATQLMRHRAVEAAELLDAEGISCEVVDLRTIAPLDVETVLESVGRTGRLACVVESPAAGSWGQAVVGDVAEQAFEHLDAPPHVIAADHVPVPYARALEEAALPSVERIAGRLRALVQE